MHSIGSHGVPIRSAQSPIHQQPGRLYRIHVETWHATSLHIYDITGHLVATLVNGKIETGFHEIQWDASFVASGVYFVELTLDNQ